MFVVRLIIYFFFFFQNNPDAHRFGSRPLYIFTNPTSPHQRFCPRRFHSKCKEAILEIKHRQILTPRYKNGTRELNEEQLFVHENVSCCLLRVVGMNLHTIHTCTYTICPEMESFFFMVFFEFAETNCRGQSWEQRSPPEMCVLVQPAFSTSVTLSPVIWWLSCRRKSLLFMWP